MNSNGISREWRARGSPFPGYSVAIIHILGRSWVHRGQALLAWPAFLASLAYWSLGRPLDWLHNRGKRPSVAPGDARTWGRAASTFGHRMGIPGNLTLHGHDSCCTSGARSSLPGVILPPAAAHRFLPASAVGVKSYR